MVLIVRVLLGVAGLAAVGLALAFWFAPDRPAAEFAITPQGLLGYSTLRADLGALFGGVGAFVIAATVRNSARLLTAPLALIAIGFCGRLLTIALSGYEPSMLQPMTVEIVLITLFATGRKVLAQN